MSPWDIVLLALLALIAVQLTLPTIQRQRRRRRRRAALRHVEAARGSRVITLIHRQETISVLGFPFRRFIDIEDSEQILRAIRLTPSEMAIDLIVHTPGGLVLASDQIAAALRRHEGRVTVMVPHYAMSGGTLVALAADQILMDRDAVLGPVDPQLGSLPGGFYPAASIISAAETPNPNRNDQTLILADMARKAIAQMHDTVFDLVSRGRPAEEAEQLATALTEGRWTHDFPIGHDQALALGLPVSDKLPADVHALMDLYPQAGQRRPSVEFIPIPYRTPAPASPPRSRLWEEE